jgi:ABC-type uncharacterized transport system permease subunit
MSNSNGVGSAARAVEKVLTVVVRALTVVVLATYFLLWTALGVRHVAAGDAVAAAIVFGVFVLPVVAMVVRGRLAAAYRGRNDPDLDVGSPSP